MSHVKHRVDPVIVDLLLAVLPVLGFAVAYGLVSNTLFLINIMIYVTLAQGINIIYGFTGYLPFGYGGFFGVGAYGTAITALHFNVPTFIAIIMGGIVAVVVGIFLVPLLKLRGAYFAIASLAAALVLAAVISNPALKGITGGPYGVHLSNIYNLPMSYALGVVLVGTSTLLIVYFRRSRFGLFMMAIRADQVSANMGGVNVVRVRTIAWLLSAAVAGFGGALYAWAVATFYPSAVFSLDVSLFAIVFALFGGVGSLLGPVIGAVVLYGVYNAIGVSQPEYFQLIFGAVIIAIVLFLPRGLASTGAWIIKGARQLKGGRNIKEGGAG